MRTPLRPVEDLSPADWLVEAVPTFDGTVDSLMPKGYAAYVRIFHRPDQGFPDDDTPPTWAAAATRAATLFHPGAQWRSLARRGPGLGDPLEGTLDKLTLPRLADHLAGHTRTPEECHFALWVGFGNTPERWQHAPFFRLPHREYWLFPTAPVRSVTDHSVEFEVAGPEELSRLPGGLPGLTVFGREKRPEDSVEWVRMMREQGDLRSPTWWWPEDRAWVVHSEIDYDSTLVAASEALAAELLDDPDIECLLVDPGTSLYYDADRINAT